MRSVLTFFSASKDEVLAFLGVGLPVAGVPILGIPHIVSVDFYDNWPLEMPELMEAVTQRLGAPPIGVIADISGRVDGTAEATEFCSRFLSRFGGIAMDDYSELRPSLDASGVADTDALSGTPLFRHIRLESGPGSHF